MSRIPGGRTIYGLALGIIMLDTKFPRIPGDVGNAGTWPFPVRYQVVRGAFPERMAQPEVDPALLEPFIEAARDLERDGVPAIITSCGFLAMYQNELAAAVSIPVLSSPLLQVPLAARAIRPNQRVAVLTARPVLTERHFAGAGWSAGELDVIQAAPPPDSHFHRTFVNNTPEADIGLLEREVAELTERIMREHDDVGAIVLECANLAPFRHIVRRIAGVPVFDLYTLGRHAQLTTVLDG